MRLHYLPSGHILISPENDCHAVVDVMLATGYSEEFCLAQDFTPEFAARLMEAGFLLMSANVADEGENPFYLMFPKLHLTRSALFFENLHVKKSIRRFLPRYDLRPDVDFDFIISRCIEKHGNDWLTVPLIECIKQIRGLALQKAPEREGLLVPTPYAYPTSFALYRGDKLVAGEFGVICGNVYTSYSGFYDEADAGSVQIILAARRLQEQGFSFFDLGMPMDYKNTLGAVDIPPDEFVRLFRG